MAGQRDRGTPIQVSATHATSAVATQAAVAGKRHYITTLSGSSDKAAALILVKDGTTVIWQDRLSNTCPMVYTFEQPLFATSGNSISVTVDGTAICNANLSGFTLDA